MADPGRGAREQLEEKVLATILSIGRDYMPEGPPPPEHLAEEVVATIYPPGTEPLTAQEASIAAGAVENVYRIQPDDHPEPHIATRIWRKLRAFGEAEAA